ncbi:hypothetical protein BP6252_12787 [Coleophoma cylindrospora]|uniref:Protein kinase domain-containing protein n=1 Tax=Coleophoma cylindrospora TaxID=1849047 RepID=A0A3D8QDG4_9HELO|nr:hypothetical protein BP6252_12787 [Coleophoma cylindrospora]
MSTAVPQAPAPQPQTCNGVNSSDHTSGATRNSSTFLQNNSDQSVPLPFQTPTQPPANSIATFRANTIAPSPSPSSSPAPTEDISRLDTASRQLTYEQPSPLSAGLRIQTDIIPNYTVTAASTTRSPTDSRKPAKAPLSRTPSIKNVLASSVGSSSNFGSAPSSALSSPMLSAMADVTPLPSPLLSGDSPGPWKKLTSNSRPASRDIMISADAALVTANGESISSAIANQSKRRAYHGIANDSSLISTAINKEKAAEGHSRNRSLSEYTPGAVQVPKVRHITVSGSHAPDSTPDSSTSSDSHMRREPHLAAQRGLAAIPGPPTPPSSRAGGESSDSDSNLDLVARSPKKSRHEYFEAYTRDDHKKRRWRAVKLLGQGTFSKVMLATSQSPEDDRIDENHVFGQRADEVLTTPEARIDPKKLVAIKICEHGPKGGASEERVEMSLKRELEIMKTIHHPSLVHLKAWSIEETRAILVLSYCPGGDLFEVASEHREILVPSLLRRMFGELVGAVRYLHERHIVHRDIKLENVLVNLPPSELARPQDWAAYPYSIITLTDLGLSRRVADDEKLTTRCGSDDYAAPEVIMGQPYDGRATDAWSIGVLLYALLESRLPFDPVGGNEGFKQRSKTSHRIARVEWRWVEYAGEEGDHEGDPEKFERAGLLGAMNVTEGLLKRARSRWTLEKVMEEEWVKGAIGVEGGIKFREEIVPDEVLA